MSDSLFVIRSVRETDLDELYRLSTMVFFLNLPADRDILKEKIQTSIDSFSGAIEDKHARDYILVMENIEDGTLIGTSSLIARHGSPDSPHMYFELRELHKYSETIHSGLIHKVLRLKFDYDGPSEIGGLMVNPNLRKHPAKLGRQLSFARFALIKARRRWFKNHVLSELMPPLTESGESILWEALGRKFTNLSYQEADKLSRSNKEFVTSLFPKGDIYTCLLAGDVRDMIGKVGPGTEPVKHMLEKIGFKWREHIDPFDGGPHYLAETDRISVVRNTRRIKVARDTLKKKTRDLALVSILVKDEFFCMQTSYEIFRHKLLLPKTVVEALRLEAGSTVFFTPLS